MTDPQDKPSPPDTTHRLDEMFTTIRSAFVQDAASNTRSAGALACRTLLGELDPPSRTTAPPTATSPASPSPPSPITAALGPLGQIPREQLVALLVGGLRSILGQGTSPPYRSPPQRGPAESKERSG
jgi:hypothetical protein